MKKKLFSLGTISSGAAWFLIVALMLYGGLVLFLIPFLVFSVPCFAAYNKQPERLWKPFTLGSVMLAILVNVMVVNFGTPFLESHSFGDIAPISGGEIPQETVYLLSVIIIGLVLLPLSAASTWHTYKNRKIEPVAGGDATRWRS